MSSLQEGSHRYSPGSIFSYKFTKVTLPSHPLNISVLLITYRRFFSLSKRHNVGRPFIFQLFRVRAKFVYDKKSDK